MTRPLLLALVAIALAAVAVPAWLVASYRPPPVPPPPFHDSMLETFQAQADESCRCSRRIGTQAGVKSCWAAFETMVAPYRKSEMATACMPVSGEWVCFDEACEKTVQIDSSTSGWCTGEEREIASRTWGNAMGKPRTDSETERGFGRANAALKAVQEKFRRGDKVVLPKAGGEAGC